MNMTSSTFPKYLAIGACVLLLSGCSGMSQTQQRTLSGAGIGAGVGAAGAAVTGGNIATGAVIGTAVGAGGGYVYDKMQEDGN
jgi:osmotically inducible lipoprotein OsmB